MFLAILKKELWERKLLIGMGALMAILPWMILQAVQWKGTLPPAAWNVFENAIVWISFFLLAVLFPLVITSSSAASEVEKGTLHFMFSLPVSRTIVWWGKLLTIVLIEYSLLGVFLTLNYLSGHLSHTGFHEIINAPGWFQVVLTAPLLLISIVFCASVLFDKEMVATLASIILMIVTGTVSLLTIRLLLWDMSSVETLIVSLLVALAYLLISYNVFKKGEQLDNFFRKLRHAGSTFLLTGPSVVILVALFFIHSTFYDMKDVENIFPRQILYNDSGIVTNISTHNYKESQVWVFSTGDSSIRRIPLRYVRYLEMAPDKKHAILFQGMYQPGPWAKLLRYEDTLGRYLINFETNEFTRLPPVKGLVQWLENGRFVFFDQNAGGTSGRQVTAFTFFDERGNIVKTANVPGARGVSHNNIYVQSIGNEIFLIYGLNILEEGTGYGNAVRVLKFDMATNKATTFFEKSAEPDETIFIPRYPVSPNKENVIYYSKNASGAWKLKVSNLAGDTKQSFDIESEPIEVTWLGYKNYLTMINQPMMNDAAAAFLVSCILDADNGKELLAEKNQSMLTYETNQKNNDIIFVAPDQNSSFTRSKLTPGSKPAGRFMMYVNEDELVRYDLVRFRLDEGRIETGYDLGTMKTTNGKAYPLDDGSTVVVFRQSIIKVTKEGEKTLLFQAGR